MNTTTHYLDVCGEPTLARWSKGHFFDAASKRFFRSHIGTGYRMMARGMDGRDARYCYFATSEQFQGSDGRCADRRGSLRVLDTQTGDVDTVGSFQGYSSIGAATRAAKRIAVKFPNDLPSRAPAQEAAR